MSKKPYRSIIEAARTNATTLRAPFTAFAVAYLLSACGSDGTASIPAKSSSGTVKPSPDPGPAPKPASTTGALTTLGSAAHDLGNTISSTSVPGVNPGVTQGAGSTVSATGDVIDAAANALSSGLGQIGSTKDPVGTTVAGLGAVVSSTSGVIAGAASTVNALGSGPLAPLSPVTNGP